MGGGDGTCNSGVYRGGDDETCTASCSCGGYCYAADYLECLAPGCITVVGDDGCSPVMECGTETRESSSTTSTESSSTSRSGASGGSSSTH
jgi:hypothetical protein